MTAKRVLQIASVLSLLFAAGHSLGGLQSWSPPGETDVLKAMQAFHFDAQGVTRSYWDFYIGFGWIISLYLLLQAVLIWQLAAVAGQQPRVVRPMVAALVVAMAVNTALSWAFFFAIPVVFSVAIAACLGWSLRVAPSRAMA